MGKNIIIQGADFHENGIVTSVLAIDRTNQMATATSQSGSSSAPFADIDYELLQGKTIIALEFRPSAAGILSVTKSTALKTGGYQVVATINVAQEDVGKITKYPLLINVASNDIIGIHDTNDTARFYYSNSNGAGFYTMIGKAAEALLQNFDLCINWYIENE